MAFGASHPVAGRQFRTRRTEAYDRQAKRWEFPPHARVKCVAKSFAGGEKGLVAVAQAR
jgi:hypothetical protein